MRPSGPVSFASRDFWVKVVGMLQQNWAVIEASEGSSATVFFVSDASQVFDRLEFRSAQDAATALERNGFRRHAGDESLSFLRPPTGPFVRGEHPNGPIYSSGRFWR